MVVFCFFLLLNVTKGKVPSSTELPEYQQERSDTGLLVWQETKREKACVLFWDVWWQQANVLKGQSFPEKVPASRQKMSNVQ